MMTHHGSDLVFPGAIFMQGADTRIVRTVDGGAVAYYELDGAEGTCATADLIAWAGIVPPADPAGK